ncbi:MAG: DUF262 domain-containing protein [Saprospiraceae bacterium]|nr:DUF262 domain-containing protein [Saprospiraceae bacterium]MBK7700946.1 DUF262 domain-containing protein [Saprospiraceae bacterium]MBK8828947.1 DUF262 domain-containing protein [Saprospiraceae bacterium]MBK9582420.1 DUF262 domain-containing protein [Saprospiraceae bacterium]
MDYTIETWNIKDLLSLIDNQKINLEPSYQRNFIWSPKNQMDLIDTIIKGYPIPNFFIFKDKNGNFEMVDGQQRSKTIYKFSKGFITTSKSTGSKKITDIIQDNFYSYKIAIILLSNISDKAILNSFYVLINKTGVNLNASEVNKAEFHGTNFMKLANEVLEYQNFIDLDIFTEAVSKRMNDRAYVEELLGYIILGYIDKKNQLDKLFEKDIDEDTYNYTLKVFKATIDILSKFNKLHPINETRYKQKNDFYTLFTFICDNVDKYSLDLFMYQYNILLILGGKDSEGYQLIRPTNEDCEVLKDYAVNCVSQSNSKTARLKRRNFFDSILLNKEIQNNNQFQDLLNYLVEQYGETKIDIKEVESFHLLDVDKFNS